MSKVKEAMAIKKYIFYVRSRVKLIQAGVLNVSDNEWLYYKALFDALNTYYKTHIIYFKCILGKIDSRRAQYLLGLTERDTFRFFARQRKKLILFIEEQETVLFAKYPFTQGEQEFAKVI